MKNKTELCGSIKQQERKEGMENIMSAMDEAELYDWDKQYDELGREAFINNAEVLAAVDRLLAKSRKHPVWGKEELLARKKNKE
jgi:hypothetical protein